MSGSKTAQLKGFATLFPEDERQPVQTVYLQPPKKKKYPVNWLTLWQIDSGIGVSMKEQAIRDDMTRTDYRVRDYLVATMDMGNQVIVNQAEMAREMNIRPASVCASLKRLCDMMILLKGKTKNGRNNVYTVNTAFLFRGNVGKGLQARAETINELKANVIPFRQGSLLD